MDVQRKKRKLWLWLWPVFLGLLLSFPGGAAASDAGESPLLVPLKERIALVEQQLRELEMVPLDLQPLRDRIAELEALLHPKLSLGEPVTAARKEIPSAGGVLKVTEPGDPLQGLEITVPSGAWKEPVELTLRHREITHHDFGPLFSPVTPLIQVENPGLLAEEPLEISIPAEIPEGYFGMAFYYNSATGQLEGLMPLASEKNKVVAATRRFSDVVVSVISLDMVTGNLNIDTGFRPGYDDWQFPNRGSWLAPGGHCAGQSVAAMWYFYQRRLQGERPLYGRYDNNDRGYGTLDFWMDDSWGYRLASSVQRELDWSSLIYKTLRFLRGANDPVTMMAFAYAMQLTGGPQYLGIATSTAPPGYTRPVGHALIAYRMEKDRIYVSDPNHHGKERYLVYEKGRFLPYNSGINAQAIAEGHDISFDLVGYLPLSRWMDWEGIGKRWEEVFSGEGKVGEDFFPPVTVEMLIKQGQNYSWIPLVDNYATDEATTAKASFNDGNRRQDMTGKLAFRIAPPYSNMRVSVYRKTAFLARDTPPGMLFSVNLEEGENDLGFYLEADVSRQRRGQPPGPPRYKFYDFQRFIVKYNEKEPEPPEKRYFFENRPFWMTGSPFANDPSVRFPSVPLALELKAEGLSGDIRPDSPEAERLKEMAAGMKETRGILREKMVQDLAAKGITLPAAQIEAALEQSLALSGLGGGEKTPGQKVLLQGYCEEGTPVHLSLGAALDPIPLVPVSMPQTPPLDGRVTVRKWFFTTGFGQSPEVPGSSGTASFAWTPGAKSKVPESFMVHLVMYYSLDFLKRNPSEPWTEGGVPLRYENLSVTFPVGVCFFPLWKEPEREE